MTSRSGRGWTVLNKRGEGRFCRAEGRPGNSPSSPACLNLCPRPLKRAGARLRAGSPLCRCGGDAGGSPPCRRSASWPHPLGACGPILEGWGLVSAGIARRGDRKARGLHGPAGGRPAAGAAVQREEEIREGLRDRGAAEQVSVRAGRESRLAGPRGRLWGSRSEPGSGGPPVAGRWEVGDCHQQLKQPCTHAHPQRARRPPP